VGNASRAVRRSGSLEVMKQRRTYIQYFSDRLQPALRLVFEFKKINHTKDPSRRPYRLRRHAAVVTGDYSVGQPVAFIAGILLKSTPDCEPALRNYLLSAAAQTALGMVAKAAGQFVPSRCRGIY
jgi:hypothetical protein